MSVFFKINSSVAWRKMSDGTVTIVSPVNEKMISINKSASLIWEGAASGKSKEQILELLYSKYLPQSELTKDILDEDAEEIINLFISKGLFLLG